MLQLWLTLVLIGLITFAYRFAFIFALERLRLPGWIGQVLRFVPVAALTAIIVPELLVRNGVVQVTWQNERLVAGIVAIVIAWRTLDDWLGIDHAWLESVEASLVARVGADTYRLVHAGHETGAHWFKVSEYR